MSRNVISNREFIGDIRTDVANGITFKNQSFVVQPGNADTFPWLNVIAQNYEQYKFHAVVFEFRSTSGETALTTTAIGSVALAAEYNVNAKPYQSKQVMENSQGAQSSKGSNSQIFKVNCNPRESIADIKFVRSGATEANDSIKWYDHAIFQIATSGFFANDQIVGELWVTYVVEFFKPQIPNQIGGNTESVHVTRTGGLIGNVFGTTTIDARSSGNVITTFPSTQSIKLSGLNIGTVYMLHCFWVGASTAVVGMNFSTTVGATPVPLFINGTTSQCIIGNGLTNQNASIQYTFKTTSTEVTITGTGTCPTGSAIDILLTTVDSTVDK